jgi:DNA-binding MarR family transcriptional regulator
LSQRREGIMMKRVQFRESSREAFLLLHNFKGFLTMLEESTYSKEAGISYQQHLILTAIETSEPPVTETRVAQAIQRNINTIGMMTDRMKKFGLVRRVRSEDDRRENHLSLTPLGRERLARGIEVGDALKEHLCSAFNEDEIREAMRLMTKLRVQILKEMGREPIPPDVDSRNR